MLSSARASGTVVSMRPSATALVFALSAAALAPSALAQNPVGQAIGAATNVAGGALGNSPAGTPGRMRTPTLGTALSPNTPRTVLTLTADGYMNLPLETFNSMRNLHPPPFDWTADGCSFGEFSGPYRDSFNRACNRHDFGYRNYGGTRLRLDRTEARRRRVDDRLRDDLNGICRSEHRGLIETPCLLAAQAIYTAARSQGRSWFMTGTGRPMQIPTPSVPGMNRGANAGPIPGLPIPSPGGGSQGSSGLPIPTGLPIPGAQKR